MVLVVADAFHQPPHEVNEWPIEWLYKAYSLIAYRNEQANPNGAQPKQRQEEFSGSSIADWE